MDVNRILSELDNEIARLQQIRTALSGVPGMGGQNPDAPRRGRPKGSKNATTTAAAAGGTKRKRELSPEGRKRIAEAMKKRWAERRKDTGK